MRWIINICLVLLPVIMVGQVRFSQLERCNTKFSIPVAKRTVPGIPDYVMTYMTLTQLIDSIDLVTGSADSTIIAAGWGIAVNESPANTWTVRADTSKLATQYDINGLVVNTRAINTTAPLTGGGNLTSDRTIGISQATTSTNGYLSSTDWNTFNGKVGGSGTATRVAFWDGTSSLSSNANLYWDNVNSELEIKSIPIGSNAVYQLYAGVNAGNGATNANDSNFFGYESGNGATGAYKSNFFGTYSGLNASGAYNSNFLGWQSGRNASGAYNSNFFGNSSGNGATNATGSNFFGYASGNGASGAYNSNFFGSAAGYIATNASASNFFGNVAGYGATNASASNFFGTNSGIYATEAYNSNFFGNSAGYGATNASSSNFFGNSSGNGATNASNSNFFGLNTGLTFSGNNLGTNNIIIGTNISLPNATSNSMNLGGVLFGTGFYSNTGGNPSIIAKTDGKIGIAVVLPQRTLHVQGEARITDLTTDTPTVIVGADADGDLGSITLGSGLSLSGGTLTATGTGGTVTSVAATGGTGISVTGSPITSSGTLTITNTAPDQVVSITGGGINAVTGTYPSFTVTGTEVDGSTTNEIQDLSLSGQTLSLTSDATTVTLPIINVTQGTGIGVSITGGNATITNTGIITEVDGSVSNELQTITNTSDATTHTVTLSNTGGSVQLAEGSGISLTTTGTGSDGVVTIAATGGGVTSVTGTAPITSTGGTTPAIGLNYDNTYMGLDGSNRLYPKYNVATWNANSLRGTDLITPWSPSSGQVLKYNGTTWYPGTDNTGGAGTVTSVGLTTGTSGTDVNVSGSPVTGSGTITLNIPSASATNRGLVTTGTQTFAGSKTFSYLGGAPVGGNSLIVADANGKLENLYGATTGHVPKWNGTSFTLQADNNSGGTVTSVGITNGGGITVTGSPITGSGSITLTAADQSATNELELPSQTGNSGKYLTTNGTSPSWATVAALPSGSSSQTLAYLSGTWTASSFLKTNSSTTATGTNKRVDINNDGGGETFTGTVNTATKLLVNGRVQMNSTMTAPTGNATLMGRNESSEIGVITVGDGLKMTGSVLSNTGPSYRSLRGNSSTYTQNLTNAYSTLSFSTPLSTLENDPFNLFSDSPPANTITVSVGGNYEISYGFSMKPTTGEEIFITLGIAGGASTLCNRAINTTTDKWSMVQASHILTLSANDTVNIQIQSTSASNTTTFMDPILKVTKL